MEMVSPDNDELVNKYLAILGFDLEFPLQYFAAQHRNMQNKVVVNFLITGESQINRNFLNSEWATVEDRMVAAAYQDPSLCRELCSHLNTSLDYSAFHGVRDEPDTATKASDMSPSMWNPDADIISQQIKQLEDILYQIRGSQYRKDGSLKMASDYQQPDEAEIKRRKKLKKRKEAK